MRSNKLVVKNLRIKQIIRTNLLRRSSSDYKGLAPPVGAAAIAARFGKAKLANFHFVNSPPRWEEYEKRRSIRSSFFILAPPVGLEPTTLRLTAACSTDLAIEEWKFGDVLLSQVVSNQVPLALKGLTSVFGMDTGGSPSLSSPKIVECLFFVHSQLHTFYFSEFRLIDPFLSCSYSLHILALISLRSLWLSSRPISIGQLHTLLCFHTRPIALSSSRGLSILLSGISNLEVGFTLRCLQRLSLPHFATLLCRWRDNRCTIDASILVLSY